MAKPKSSGQKARPRGIVLLPNLFTISALFAGFFAVVAAMKGHFTSAAIAIFVGMLMDALDGRVARLTHTQTAFGAELDSLSDMVSFGIAPALVVYSWALYHLGKIGWLLAFFYAMATALRLARFNTQIERVNRRYFQGVPSPAAAGAVAGMVWVCAKFSWNSWPVWIIAALATTALAALMVSKIRYHSFKEISLKGNVPFLVILFIVLILMLIATEPAIVLTLIFGGYAVSGVIVTFWQLRRRRKAKRVMHNG